MVLFALEESLSATLRSLVGTVDHIPTGLRKELASRLAARQGAVQPSLPALLDECYLSELLQIGAALPERPEAEHVGELAKLMTSLGINEMRNTVCHPVRCHHITEHDWMRLSVIATAPAVSILSLSAVTRAYDNACQGLLTSPPDAWFRRTVWKLPNNMPEVLEHEVTGLVGRNDDLRALRAKVLNTRFTSIAVTGPGGIGKTALCQECLRQIVLDPHSASQLEAVIFLSAKTHRLTHAGLEPLGRFVDTLDQLREDLFSTIASVFELGTPTDGTVATAADRAVLIYVDNLETLLTDGADEFDSFTASLPPRWRLLVTSRIRIDAASVLPLKPLTEAGSMYLARHYAVARGCVDVSPELLRRIATEAHGNPLAVRLTIDAVAAGVDVAEALAVAGANLLEFSFASLLEAIPSPCKTLLECLFVLEAPSDAWTIEYLIERSRDEVADALRHVVKTSLVEHTTAEGEPRYSLSRAARDLLLRRPIDLVIRQNALSRTVALRKEQERAETADTNVLARGYCPPDRGVGERTLIHKTARAVRGGVRATCLAHLGQVDERLVTRSGDAYLWRLKANLHEALDDRVGAIAALKEGAKCVPPEPATLLQLAELLFRDRDFRAARDSLEPLWSQGLHLDSRIPISDRERLAITFCLSRAWSGQHDAVIADTSGWPQDGSDMQRLFATMFITAMKARLEEKAALLVEWRQVALQTIEAADTMLMRFGYFGAAVDVSIKLQDELGFRVSSGDADSEVQLKWAAFLDRHLQAICTGHKWRRIDEPEIVRTVSRLRDAAKSSGATLLAGPFWSRLCGETNEAPPEDAVVMTVRKIPHDRVSGRRKSYAFCIDNVGAEYFLAVPVEGAPRGWFDSLKEGDNFTGIAEAAVGAGRFPTVKRVWVGGENLGPAGVPHIRVPQGVPRHATVGEVEDFTRDNKKGNIAVRVKAIAGNQISVEDEHGQIYLVENDQGAVLVRAQKVRLGMECVVTRTAVASTARAVRLVESPELLLGDVVSADVVELLRRDDVRWPGAIRKETVALLVAVVRESAVVTVDVSGTWHWARGLGLGSVVQLRIQRRSTTRGAVYRAEFADPAISVAAAREHPLTMLVTGVQRYAVWFLDPGGTEQMLRHTNLGVADSTDLSILYSVGQEIAVEQRQLNPGEWTWHLAMVPT
ncbi:MAG TPA: ATP-binding protein [Phycisphaerales bacterium]|nr:ATP-binding protein [Phycisphaerales bacterium]